jgi:hypothetical protein
MVDNFVCKERVKERGRDVDASPLAMLQAATQRAHRFVLQ